MKTPTFLLTLALLLLPSCAIKEEAGSRRSTRVLTAEEIAEAPVTTAYEAVSRYRPQWLRTRSSPTPTNPNPSPPVVYLDGVRLGGLSELERISAGVVERMEYLYPNDATNRFGTGHTGGAILVTTR